MSLCEEDAINLHKWGFNVVRLYVAWQGTEIKPLVYDDEYLKHLRNVVDILGKHDVFVILDCHQDVASRKYCGEGFPEWYVNNTKLPFPFPVPVDIRFDPTTGYPLWEDCLKYQFFEYYFTYSLGETFQELYTNQNVRNAFSKFWKRVATDFSDVSNVLGYELINEPWFGNIYHDAHLLEPGVTDKKYLQPMYEQIYKDIKEVDGSHMIFFEPSVGNIGPAGFEGCVTGADIERCVYTYHMYCAWADEHGEPKYRFLCNLFDDTYIEMRHEDAKRIGGGVFLSEFGADSNSSSSIEEMNWLLSEAEKRFHSYSYWAFKYFNDITTHDHPGTTESFYDIDGNLKVEKVKVLSRTWAPKTCGLPTFTNFNMKDSSYHYEYEYHDCKGKPTVVYLNEEYYYPDGYNVDVSPSDLVTYKEVEKNYLEFEHNEKISEGQKVTIIVTKKE